MVRPILFHSSHLRVATVIAMAVIGVASLASTATADERLDGVLHSWVAGAAEVEAPSLATARARFGRELSAHQLEAAVFLWVPNSVASLTAKFDWTIDSTGRDESLLTGIPCDEIDRAFIGTVEVRWDADTQRPRSIQFAGGSEPIEFATIRRAGDPAVDHVVFYQEAAESGAEAIVDNVSQVRTASAVIGESVTNIELPITTMDVDDILDRWAAASAFNGPWEISGESFAYDADFGIEKRSYFMMRGDGAGTIEFRTDPMDVEPGTVNEQRLRADGEPYEVVADGPGAYVFTPEEVISAEIQSQSLIRTPNSSFERVSWFKHPLRTPSDLTFNLPVDADELQEQFDWEITQQSEDEFWLRATPRTEEVARCVTTVDIILDATSFLPKAVRCAGGGHEEVMVVEERSTPTGLTASIILEGYANYTEAGVPQKGNRDPEGDANAAPENSPTLSECVLWASIILRCL